MELQDLDNDIFVQMPNFLYGIKIMYISCPSNFRANDVVKFLEKTKHLRDFEMRIFIAYEEQKPLNEKLSSKWELKFSSHADGTMSIRMRHKKYEHNIFLKKLLFRSILIFNLGTKTHIFISFKIGYSIVLAMHSMASVWLIYFKNPL